MQPQSYDNVHKHKKEKEIDKFLYKAEKNRVKELKQQVNHFEKIIDIKLARKRDREDNKSEDVKDDVKEENKEKIQINYQFAIDKILKHIEKPSALNKCLNLLKTIFINLKEIRPLILIKIFYNISNLSVKFHDEEAVKAISELYEYTKNEITRLGDNYVNEDSKILFDLFIIPFQNQISLITDDSFKFNSSLKQIEKKFNLIRDYNADCDEQNEIAKFEKLLREINNEEITVSTYHNHDEEDINTVKSITLHENKIDITILKEALERNLLFDCIKQAFTYYKFKWAFNSINTLLTKLYYDKAKLNPSQIEQLESMISIIKNKNVCSSRIETTRSNRDDKIKNNPLESYHKVADGRSEVYVESSLDTWTAKQSGNTSSKMFINN